MSESTELRIYEPQPAAVAAAHVSGMEAYRALCAEAEADHQAYWSRLARELITWKTPFTQADRKSTRLNSSHRLTSRMPSSA
jgi:acetyl-CoA synthetase